MPSATWTRPTDVPFPSVWSRYRGRRPLPDGTVPSFVIHDVTPELEDAVVDHMRTHFLRDETMCKSSRLLEDPVSLAEITIMWKEVIAQKIALVALVDDPTSPVPRIAGANMTGVCCKGHKDEPGRWKGVAVKKFNGLMEATSATENIFEKYGVDEYMNSLGLSVDPEFRGQRLGLALLLTRSDIGRAVGLKVTATVFTAFESQTQAVRAGFEVLGEITFSEYKDDDGHVVFPDAKPPTSMWMAKKLV